MKKTIVLMMAVAICVSLLSSVVCAQGFDTGFYTSLKVNTTSLSASGFAFVPLDSTLTYNFWYEGSAVLKVTNGVDTAKLIGNNTKGNIWQYYYQTTAMHDNEWYMFDSLVGQLNYTPSSITACAHDVKNNTALELTGLRAMGIGYNVTLSKTGPGRAYGMGLATLTATALPASGSVVPEPGTILAAFSILAPAAMIFRRKN